MQADYVIVGAGSAGCVLAERLSAGGAEVVLLEAGGRDTNPLIHVPAGVLRLITHPVVNWNYYTEPDEKIGGRVAALPARQGAGRVVLDQRHAVYPRQCCRLPTTGRSWARATGPTTM